MKFPNLTGILYNKTWGVLVIALAIGGLAAFAAQSYLSRRMAEIEAGSRGQTVKVVVAKRELKTGELLSPETVAVREVPVAYAHSQAIRPEAFEGISGNAIAWPLQPGEMILWPVLANRKAASFSTRVADGRRAITVPVDEINSISGLLEPGDIVDLILTLDRNDKKYSFIIQQKVSVLATGQRALDDPGSGERRQYSTVTLDATPDEAKTIIRAREAGKLTALLRNRQDAADLGEDEMAARFLRDMAGGGEVPVLYGGRSGRLPREGLHLNMQGQQAGAEAGSLPLQMPPQMPVPPLAGQAPVSAASPAR